MENEYWTPSLWSMPYSNVYQVAASIFVLIANEFYGKAKIETTTNNWETIIEV